MTHETVYSPVGFNAHVGLKLVEWDSDHACLALQVEDHHLNGLDIAHGGVLLAALDAACGMAGCYRPPPKERRWSMTVTLTTNFVSPQRCGAMRATGKRVGGGKTIFFAESEIIGTDGALIAKASGAFRYLRGKPDT